MRMTLEIYQERIDEIDAYISEQENNGKKVYILDAEAAIYMIPINKYNKEVEDRFNKKETELLSI